jgi:hypothetical protein
MKIQQLSIFAENKPGHLAGPCRLLAEQGVDIRALSVADTQRFGILRLIVNDAAKATKVLETAGHVVKTTEVLAVEVADQPGGLAQVLVGPGRLAGQHRVHVRLSLRPPGQGRAHLPLRRSRRGHCSIASQGRIRC